MGKIKKKYESGEATAFMSRKMALRKLQLSLKMFRKLCILKGIYPREPKNRKKAQKGATDKKTLYLKKDIQFLLHEPIVWKLREHKVYLRKKGRAKALHDKVALKRVVDNKPMYKLDHIVKERYPTFIDAIRDLDDCLTLTFLFSTFPSLRFVPGSMSSLCRRLTVEFLHYVIEARALRKVFVSIKGYYYQAEIKGQTVTWIVPHYFGFQPQSPDEVDFRIMATFVEFYNTVLGFTNFRLFHSLNICYPPKLLTPRGTAEELNATNRLHWDNEEDLVSERVAALNQSLLRSSDAPVEEQVPEMDEFPVTDDAEKLEEMKREAERVKKLKNLFGGLKFYLGREVPREALCFMIRAVGGQASWNGDLFPGATFDESDDTITHQITDRNLENKQHVSRYYIQPQWVFDCINARALLPVDKYFPGAVLPPHLSPFHTEREGDYMPPEKRKFVDMEKGIVTPEDAFELANAGEEGEQEEEDDDDDDIDEEEDEGDLEASEEDEELDEDERALKDLKKQMKVTKGEAEIIDELKKRDDETKEQWRLRTMMIKNKHKRLYRKMMDSRRKRRREADRLASKRIQIDESTTKKPKKTKKSKAK
ncbi:Pescadillo [Orchesella cincta]|uniref:Pescadillo homolog n=1 Tax=Orchesella cincta TaxID=48709 RepID=A0A1D2N1W3_ORCCI|nr:Pescadillo [Orchesella cincta]